MQRQLAWASVAIAPLLLLASGCLDRSDFSVPEPSPQTPLSPTHVSANANRMLPRTQITFGPADLGWWFTDVEFSWASVPGYARPTGGFRYALTSLQDYVRDGGSWDDSRTQIFAWLDTLQYYPNFSGGYFTDSVVWHATADDSIAFPYVAPTTGRDRILFAVRGTDHGGTEALRPIENTRLFNIPAFVSGPCISMDSNIAGTWNCNELPFVREVFRGRGFQFHWRARPGVSAAPVAGFSYAVDDSSNWPPYSWVSQYPPGDELWLPDPGLHRFFVRVIDERGYTSVLSAQLMVYAGPRDCPAGSRYVLVVLDTVPTSLAGGSYTIWPIHYREVEQQLVQYWLQGCNFQIFETRGSDKPPLSILDCASSVIWFVSSDIPDGDSSVLNTYHSVPPNPLPSYVASGGNLMICGLQPVSAARYTQNVDTGDVMFMNNLPLNFQATLVDTTIADHWFATQFGIALVNETIASTISDVPDLIARRLRLCRSHVTSGPHPYPDLPFDPLAWPQGPIQRGFGFYDRGIVPMVVANPAEVVYTANDSNDAIAIRRLTSPGVNGNLVYAGFHPYFVGRPEFRQFIRAVLADFGETPAP
ncbi:MAG: hypothetical protein U0167_13645 [bacterium]